MIQIIKRPNIREYIHPRGYARPTVLTCSATMRLRHYIADAEPAARLGPHHLLGGRLESLGFQVDAIHSTFGMEPTPISNV